MQLQWPQPPLRILVVYARVLYRPKHIGARIATYIRATRSVDGSVGVVVFALGSHHSPPARRRTQQMVGDSELGIKPDLQLVYVLRRRLHQPDGQPHGRKCVGIFLATSQHFSLHQPRYKHRNPRDGHA